MIDEIAYSETIITEEKEEPFVLDPEKFIQNSIKNQNFVIYDTNKDLSPLRMSKQQSTVSSPGKIHVYNQRKSNLH